MNDTATQPHFPTADVAASVDVLHGATANAVERELLAKIDSPAQSVQIGDETIQVAAGDRIMNSATEIAGPGGADVTGGELTPPQDAEQTLDENIAQRDEEQDMFRRQMEEEVETQTKDLEPNNNPDSGAAAEERDAQQQRDESASGAGTSASTRSSAETQEDDHTRYLRALADLENFKRQSMRRENETRERTTRRVIEDILPVLDNFERAVEASKTARDVDSVRIGIEFVAQQLRDVLKGHGVQPIETSGATFDPLQHEALEEVAGTEHEEGAIIGEVQRGYTHNGQVLRTSRVRVAGK